MMLVTGLTDLMASLGTPELTIWPAWEMRLLKVWFKQSQWKGKKSLHTCEVRIVGAGFEIVCKDKEGDIQDPTGKKCQFELLNESIVPEHLSMLFGVLSLSFRFGCV